MATTPRNFETCLAKGEYGESIVRRLFEEKGYIVYNPKTKGAHPFDIFALNTGKPCIAADVKSKPRRILYPDTGISLKHYNIYLNFSKAHSMEFWIIFVDQNSGDIYGNTISKLDVPRIIDNRTYPLNEDKTRYWPVKAMRFFHKLTDQEMKELNRLSQINDKYKRPENRMTQPEFAGFSSHALLH